MTIINCPQNWVCGAQVIQKLDPLKGYHTHVIKMQDFPSLGDLTGNSE